MLSHNTLNLEAQTPETCVPNPTMSTVFTVCFWILNPSEELFSVLEGHYPELATSLQPLCAVTGFYSRQDFFLHCIHNPQHVLY